MTNFRALLFGLPAIFAAPAASAGAPTFCKQVAPILFQRCVGCHRPGQIASAASFLSYESARPWARAIREKVLLREMPPWPPDPQRSAPFLKDARLSGQDIRTLAAWADAGAAKGEPSDLPAPPEPAQAWLHPKGIPPDAVIALPEVQNPGPGHRPICDAIGEGAISRG